MRPVLIWLRKAWPQPQQQVAIVKGYKDRFGAMEGAEMEDLRTFCNIYDSTQRPDQIDMNVQEGRRQVYLHIVNMLNINPDELKPPKAKQDDRDSINTAGSQ